MGRRRRAVFSTSYEGPTLLECCREAEGAAEGPHGRLVAGGPAPSARTSAFLGVEGTGRRSANAVAQTSGPARAGANLASRRSPTEAIAPDAHPGEGACMPPSASDLSPGDDRIGPLETHRSGCPSSASCPVSAFSCIAHRHSCLGTQHLDHRAAGLPGDRPLCRSPVEFWRTHVHVVVPRARRRSDDFWRRG